MRDPDLVQRAERAAAALEEAWLRWRDRYGLGAGKLPPVSSYVGYSHEEPWGQPRVVFGLEATEAERFAAILDGYEFAGRVRAEAADSPERRQAQVAPASWTVPGGGPGVPAQAFGVGSSVNGDLISADRVLGTRQVAASGRVSSPVSALPAQLLRVPGMPVPPQPIEAQVAAARAASAQAGPAQAESAQPATPEPVAAQPAAAQPIAAQPTAAQPAAAQPIAAQPTTEQPASAQPAAGQPGSAQSAAGQPAAEQPASAKPIAVQPTTAQPASAQPAPAQPAPARAASGRSAKAKLPRSARLSGSAKLPGSAKSAALVKPPAVAQTPASVPKPAARKSWPGMPLRYSSQSQSVAPATANRVTPSGEASKPARPEDDVDHGRAEGLKPELILPRALRQAAALADAPPELPDHEAAYLQELAARPGIVALQSRGAQPEALPAVTASLVESAWPAAGVSRPTGIAGRSAPRIGQPAPHLGPESSSVRQPDEGEAAARNGVPVTRLIPVARLNRAGKPAEPGQWPAAGGAASTPTDTAV